jgi:hypothetical protein
MRKPEKKSQRQNHHNCFKCLINSDWNHLWNFPGTTIQKITNFEILQLRNLWKIIETHPYTSSSKIIVTRITCLIHWSIIDQFNKTCHKTRNEYQPLMGAWLILARSSVHEEPRMLPDLWSYVQNSEVYSSEQDATFTVFPDCQ